MSRSEALCIFCCRADVKPSEEHIFPQSLVGKRSWEGTGAAAPAVLEELTLNGGEVCTECNRDLGKIDAKVTEELGILKVFWNDTGTKRGSPSTAKRPGLHAERVGQHVHIVVNAEPHAVTTEGGLIVPPARGAKGLTFTEAVVDGRSVLHCSQPITIGKNFVRAIHKIGFEALCLRKGRALVLSRSFDELRRYILWGHGSRTLFVPVDATSKSFEAAPSLPTVDLERSSEGERWSARIVLGLPFLVDLTGDGSFPWSAELRGVSDRKPRTYAFNFTMPAPWVHGGE